MQETSMSEDGPKIRCPVCNNSELNIKAMMYSVPYFNELVFFTMACPQCNFKHNDIFSAEQRRPARWTLRVDDETKMSIRVVRSSSGTIRIPEFGIDIEPGPAADGFITNVEGVLLRIKPVLQMAINFAETDEQRHHGEHLMEELDLAIEGRRAFTLIIEDPVGVSAILPDDLTLVTHEELTDEEAAGLRGAPMWIDAARREVWKRKG